MSAKPDSQVTGGGGLVNALVTHRAMAEALLARHPADGASTATPVPAAGRRALATARAG